MRADSSRAWCIAGLAVWGALMGAPQSTAAAQAQARDSAGIRIVENRSPAWSAGDRWRVSDEPELVIGGFEATGPHALYRASQATRLSDGAVAVMLWSPNLFEVRIFEPDGSHRATMGRFGDGPFEVGASPPVLLTRLSGDSLMVLSVDGRRIVFGPNGEKGRSGRVKEIGPLRDAKGMLDARRIVLRHGLRGGASAGWIQGRSVYALHDVSDGTVDTLTTVEGAVGWHRMNYGFFPMPFGAGPHAAVGADRVWIGRSDRYEIRSWDASGSLRSIVRNARPQTEVTAALERQYRAWQLETRGRGANGRERIDAWHGTIRFPSEFPAYDDLAVDAEGYLWVLQYEPPWTKGDLEWDVYDPDGRWLGVVSMPYEASPSCRREASSCLTVEIGRNYLLVRDRDSFDAQRVKVYGLTR